MVDCGKGDKASIDKIIIEFPHIIAIAEKLTGFFTDQKTLKKIGHIFNSISIIHGQLGEFEKALEYSKRALTIHEKVYGENRPHTDLPCDHIGLFYNLLGEYDQALEYHNRALEICEKTYGKKHPETALNYNNIGAVYANLYRQMKSSEYYNTALKYYNRALRIYEQINGNGNYLGMMALVRNNIGVTYYDFGESMQALKYHKRALEIREKIYGCHPETASSCYNVGVAYSNLRNRNKTLEYLQRALKIYEQIYGENYQNAPLPEKNLIEPEFRKN